MTYHPLSEDTGQTPERRLEESQKIVKMLFDELGDALGGTSERESTFLCEMQGADSCSPKQLFWLRDLKEKYL